MSLLQRSLVLLALAMAPSAVLTGLGAAVAAPAAGYTATVLSVGDGDTFRVQAGNRAITIRLACIDAPETAQSPYGQQSRAYLQQRLPRGRQVSIPPLMLV
jgi:endonuclease YncB( thermonuclease family)